MGTVRCWFVLFDGTAPKTGYRADRWCVLADVMTEMELRRVMRWLEGYRKTLEPVV